MSSCTGLLVTEPIIDERYVLHMHGQIDMGELSSSFISGWPMLCACGAKFDGTFGEYCTAPARRFAYLLGTTAW